MAKPDKKRRREEKRKAKRQAIRRREAGGPIKRLAAAPGEAECWMSEGFERIGQLEIFAYKRGAGTGALACFLVDRGVVGLKDAFTRTGVEREDLESALQASRDHGISVRRVDVAEARRWVAAGLRWAHDNGMRLPRDWVKPASLIGGVGDWKSADVSAFAKEFAGHPDDLRRRLIGEPFESYLRRSDVDFVFSDTAPVMDQRTGEYLNTPGADEFDALPAGMPMDQINELAEQLALSADGLAADTAAFLRAKGEAPSAELSEAWRSIMLSSMIAKSSKPDAEPRELQEFAYDVLDQLDGRIDDARFDEYDRAVDQALEHLATDTTMMQKAILKYALSGEIPDQLER